MTGVSVLRWLSLAMLVAAPALAAETKNCAPAGAKEAVAGTVKALYEALTKDDEAAWRRLVTPDFMAYDVGRRFDGDALIKMVEDAHKAGRKLEWHIEDLEVHLDCDWAWTNHVNHGAASDANGQMQPVTWLESTVQTYRRGQWRVVFLHATRAPSKTP